MFSPVWIDDQKGINLIIWKKRNGNLKAVSNNHNNNDDEIKFQEDLDYVKINKKE